MPWKKSKLKRRHLARMSEWSHGIVIMLALDGFSGFSWFIKNNKLNNRKNHAAS